MKTSAPIDRRTLAGLLVAWFAAEVGTPEAANASNLLADFFEEAGLIETAEWFRNNHLAHHFAGVLPAMSHLKSGRSRLDKAVGKIINSAAEQIHLARKDRRTNPDGHFEGGRWYPSDAEDCNDFAGKIRRPSARWPYSYMHHARTRKHCRLLVWFGVAGHPVPPDAAAAVKAARESVLAAIAGAA